MAYERVKPTYKSVVFTKPFRITGLLRHVRKIAKSDFKICRVCPSVRMEKLGSRWADFHEIWYVSIFRKPIEEIEVSLQSDKNNGCCT